MNSITFFLCIGALCAVSIVNAHRGVILARKTGENVAVALCYLMAPVALSVVVVAVVLMKGKR